MHFQLFRKTGMIKKGNSMRSDENIGKLESSTISSITSLKKTDVYVFYLQMMV